MSRRSRGTPVGVSVHCGRAGAPPVCLCIVGVEVERRRVLGRMSCCRRRRSAVVLPIWPTKGQRGVVKRGGRRRLVVRSEKEGVGRARAGSS